MKVYILEDETNILQYIISLIDKIPNVVLVGYAADIHKAAQEIPELQPDLVLADIQLKDGISFSLFEKIPITFQIIFITAYNQYAIQALNLGACAYLLKPFEETEFAQAVDGVSKKLEQESVVKQQIKIAQNLFNQQHPIKKIALKSVDYTEIVNIEDIIYCQSDKGYTTFYMKDNSKIMVSKVLKEFETLLPENIFIRCHQSYMFNIDYLKKYFREGHVELSNGAIIPVSGRKKSYILELIDHL